MRRALLPVLLTLATLDLVLSVAAQLPWANGPAEWRWGHHPARPAGLSLLLAACLVVPLLLWAAQDRAGADPRWAVPLLIALGWALTLDVARGQEGGFKRVMNALASRHTFGYVFDEGVAPPTRELL